MTTGLTADDFPEFYQAVHGHDPFPWQRDLVARVLADNCWPTLVDVPTGLGKTSMLDISVFVTAATADQGGADRLGRRRCFLVVDRRLVVDEATRHAQAIAEALRAAERDGAGGVLGEVVRGLRSLAPDRPKHSEESAALLPVTRMRGGVTWDASWLSRPDVPGVVIGTVDQVGSRLLFRGYGVGDRRRPIDAALVGTDSLILVDEAHLATALLETMRAVAERDRLGLSLPGAEVVRLTATSGAPAEDEGWRYTIDVATHEGQAAACVEARRRLTAPKELHLVESTEKTCPRAMATIAVGLAEAAAKAASAGWAPSILVVCNTVDRARTVHTLVDRAITDRRGERRMDLELLIGRSRAFDRVDLTERVLTSHGSSREPSPDPASAAPVRPAILVATQTVEVGVNLDGDGLVTESASWEALVQRLGRLNRLGRCERRMPGVTPKAFVIHDGVANGPVYRAARDVTWSRLSALLEPEQESSAGTGPGLSVSPLACRELGAQMPAGAVAPPRDVPVLAVPTLDAWATTAPVPLDDPPIEPFLHGFDAGRAGVTIAWRDGLTSDDALDDPFAEAEETGEQPAPVADALLTAMPIRAGEQVEVPLPAVTQWMRGLRPAPVGDVETAPVDDARPRQERDPFRVLAWRGDPGTGVPEARPSGQWVWIDHWRVRPGDQIVVPTERGGLDRFGWNPASGDRVSDVAEAVALASGHPCLRLDADLGRRLGLAPDQRHDLASRIDHPDEESPEADLIRAVRDAVSSPHSSAPPTVLGTSTAQLLNWLDSGPHLVEITDESKADDRVVGGARYQPRVLGRLLVGTGREPEGLAAGTGRPVALAHHHARVRERAELIASNLGLPPELVRTVEDAARWHDLGKSDRRVQVTLHGGDRFEADAAPEDLAKSGMDPRDRTTWRAARVRGGLPAGARHEVWSATLVRDLLTRRAEPYPGDEDLLIHLIASHHGHARPWTPLVVDPDPRAITTVIGGVKITADTGETVLLDHPARFARLNDRYGRWGLALLESVIRCADMTVSSEGS